MFTYFGVRNALQRSLDQTTDPDGWTSIGTSANENIVYWEPDDSEGEYGYSEADAQEAARLLDWYPLEKTLAGLQGVEKLCLVCGRAKHAEAYDSNCQSNHEG